jgi:hypothetical protein
MHTQLPWAAVALVQQAVEALMVEMDQILFFRQLHRQVVEQVDAIIHPV